MKRKFLSTAAVAFFAASSAWAAPESVQLTIYNQNFGLVKETRTVNLKAGINQLAIEDVATQIQPATVHFTSLTAPASVTILEQNYQYDLLSVETILNKSVGNQITVRNTETKEVVTGTLLNLTNNASSLIIRKADGAIVVNPVGQIELLNLPEGLISVPRLLWMLDSDKAGEHKSELSYMTGGLNWVADYVAVVGKGDSSIDLQGWVTLTNNSGTSYKNASLQLVAGDVRRVTPQLSDSINGGLNYDMARATAKEAFIQEQLFDYYLYTLQRPTDVLDRETKQVSLLDASGIKVKKKYTYDGVRNMWWWRPNSGYRPGESYDTSDYKKVNVTIEFKNSKDNNLGMPLPKGTIRVYKKDSADKLQFVGEDSIDHTPKDEELRLYIGDAFDLVGERKRTNFKRISDSVVQESFEVTVRNHKDTAETVTIVEHLYGDWEVLSKSHPFTKQDASTINFDASVPASGATTVKYTVQTRW